MSEAKHRLYFLIYQLARQLKKTADEALLDSAGLTTAQATALRIIVDEKRTTQRHVARTLDQQESAVGTMTKRLIKAGYITKRPSEEDRRAFVLEPTAQGVEAINKLLSAFVTIDGLVGTVLPDDRVDALSEDLLAILKSLDTARTADRNTPDENAP